MEDRKIDVQKMLQMELHTEPRKITFFCVNCMALTLKQEITIWVLSDLDDSNQEFLVYRKRDEKQVFKFSPLKDWLIFDGWDLPLELERVLSPKSYVLMDWKMHLGGVDDVLVWVKKNNLNTEFERWEMINDINKNPNI